MSKASVSDKGALGDTWFGFTSLMVKEIMKRRKNAGAENLKPGFNLAFVANWIPPLAKPLICLVLSPHLKMGFLGRMITEDSLSPSILQFHALLHGCSSMTQTLLCSEASLPPPHHAFPEQHSTQQTSLLLTLSSSTFLKFSSALKNGHVSGLHILEANQGTKVFAHFLKVANCKTHSKSMTPLPPPPTLEQLDKCTWAGTGYTLAVRFQVLKEKKIKLLSPI